MTPKRFSALMWRRRAYIRVDEILQLSIINGNGKILFSEYIRPKNATEWPGAEAVNGISPARVSDRPHIDEYIPRLNSILASAKLIVGYNVSFDLGFLEASGVIIPEGTDDFDVMGTFTNIYGEWDGLRRRFSHQKLSTCAAYYGYEGSGNFHDSLEDVRATLYCYYAMTEGNDEDTP